MATIRRRGIERMSDNRDCVVLKLISVHIVPSHGQQFAPAHPGLYGEGGYF
jgi:hypothetical protein